MCQVIPLPSRLRPAAARRTLRRRGSQRDIPSQADHGILHTARTLLGYEHSRRLDLLRRWQEECSAIHRILYVRVNPLLSRMDAEPLIESISDAQDPLEVATKLNQLYWLLVARLRRDRHAWSKIRKAMDGIGECHERLKALLLIPPSP